MRSSVGGGAAAIDGRAEKESGKRPADPIDEHATASQEAYASLARYPLLDALIERRSRRFGEGMRLNGGPLAYDSTHVPQPLSLEEEAALAFAGSGITGFALADLPYESGEVPEAGGGNIMTHFVGRTARSALPHPLPLQGRGAQSEAARVVTGELSGVLEILFRR